MPFYWCLPGASNGAWDTIGLNKCLQKGRRGGEESKKGREGRKEERVEARKGEGGRERKRGMEG